MLNYRLDLKLFSEDSKVIESLFLSLKPEESSQADEKRGKVSVSKDLKEGLLILSIESSSEGGFRALVNSYFYLLKASLDSLKAVSEH